MQWQRPRSSPFHHGPPRIAWLLTLFLCMALVGNSSFARAECCYSIKTKRDETNPQSYSVNVTGYHDAYKNEYSAFVQFPPGYTVKPVDTSTCFSTSINSFECHTQGNEQFRAPFEVNTGQGGSTPDVVVSIFGESCRKETSCSNLTSKDEDSDKVSLGPFGRWPKIAVIIAGVVLGLFVAGTLYLFYRRKYPKNRYVDDEIPMSDKRNDDKRNDNTPFAAGGLLQASAGKDKAEKQKSAKPSKPPKKKKEPKRESRDHVVINMKGSSSKTPSSPKELGSGLSADQFMPRMSTVDMDEISEVSDIEDPVQSAEAASAIRPVRQPTTPLLGEKYSPKASNDSFSVSVSRAESRKRGDKERRRERERDRDRNKERGTRELEHDRDRDDWERQERERDSDREHRNDREKGREQGSLSRNPTKGSTHRSKSKRHDKNHDEHRRGRETADDRRPKRTDSHRHRSRSRPRNSSPSGERSGVSRSKSARVSSRQSDELQRTSSLRKTEHRPRDDPGRQASKTHSPKSSLAAEGSSDVHRSKTLGWSSKTTRSRELSAHGSTPARSSSQRAGKWDDDNQEDSSSSDEPLADTVPLGMITSPTRSPTRSPSSPAKSWRSEDTYDGSRPIVGTANAASLSIRSPSAVSRTSSPMSQHMSTGSRGSRSLDAGEDHYGALLDDVMGALDERSYEIDYRGQEVPNSDDEVPIGYAM